MPKRKARSGPSFHPSFQPPSSAQRREAIGQFPGAVHASASRRALLLGNAVGGAAAGAEDALEDLNDAALYEPLGRSVTTMAIPRPKNDLDWLATVPEEGQTFDDYVRFLTSRSGRFRPIANAECRDIVLLPIVRGGTGAEGGAANAQPWPSHGPPLEGLVDLARAYFSRPVRLLPPAVITQASGEISSKKPGAFARAAKAEFQLCFPFRRPDGSVVNFGPSRKVTGRKDGRSGRVQFKVEPLLDELAAFREGRMHGISASDAADGGEPLHSSSFCVMGITMEDLYQSPSDLFIAGLAFGGSKVALFSFARYHPHLKMHPGVWQHYGYGRRADDYSYYEDHDQNPTGLSGDPPALGGLGKRGASELLRRCGKLLVHELGHLYGLGHCIFNRCVMMGTGHLVEDFAAPFHLCPVCLRKMQWRLGFKVARRYEVLASTFSDAGLDQEGKWAKKQSVGLLGTESSPVAATSPQVGDLTNS